MASRYGTLSAVSAAWRTIGLALKAMPRPATASMSRSFAPSPTAMVRDRGTPAAAANRRRASAFPARSTIGPTSPPVSTPSSIASWLAARWSMPSSATKGPINWVNPPLTTAVS